MSAERSTAVVPNGGGAAALLAAGIGCLALAVLAIAGDQIAWMKSAMTFSKATGPLSGVTTTAVVIWLVVWVVLNGRWKRKTVEMGKVSVGALTLLVLGLLLTFPPIADVF
jgi:hypothetical protein